MFKFKSPSSMHNVIQSMVYGSIVVLPGLYFSELLPFEGVVIGFMISLLLVTWLLTMYLATFLMHSFDRVLALMGDPETINELSDGDMSDIIASAKKDGKKVKVMKIDLDGAENPGEALEQALREISDDIKAEMAKREEAKESVNED